MVMGIVTMLGRRPIHLFSIPLSLPLLSPALSLLAEHLLGRGRRKGSPNACSLIAAALNENCSPNRPTLFADTVPNADDAAQRSSRCRRTAPWRGKGGGSCALLVSFRLGCGYGRRVIVDRLNVRIRGRYSVW